MKLLVLSDYGSREYLKKKNPSESDILETMNSIDWNLFHQVVLSKNNYDWIEVGGNLKEDGLSVMYEKNNEQFVINKAPSSINQLTEILLSYFNNDGKFNKIYKFNGENNKSNSTYDAEKVLKNLIENERKVSFEKNKTESYSAWEMILIFVFGPLKFFHRYDVVFSLRKENYLLKFKQRIKILTLGFISWFIVIYLTFNYYEQKRLQEIENIDISDWKKKHGYE